jgi:hypothetical protein
MFSSHYDGATTYLDRLVAAKAKVVRDDCYSGNCDSFLLQAKNHGLKLVLILSSGNQNPNPTTIGSFASALVNYADANYPGTLIAVEPMNEPNGGTFSSNAAGYVTMHNAVYDAVHATGKPVQVWCCATSGTGQATSSTGWTAQVLDDGVEFDQWSAHPYPAWGFGLTASQELDLNRSSAWSEMPALASMLQSKRGYPGPINGTEFGEPTNPPGGSCSRCAPEQQQADVITMGYAQWKLWSFAGTLFVYTGEDDCTYSVCNTSAPYEDHFGIYRSDNTAKPAVAAYQAVVG